MSKIEQDKYYTPKDLAKRLIETTFRLLSFYGVEDITQIVQPSAGNGSFSSQIQNCVAGFNFYYYKFLCKNLW